MHFDRFVSIYGESSLLITVMSKMLAFNHIDRYDFLELKDALPDWSEVILFFQHNPDLLDVSHNRSFMINQGFRPASERRVNSVYREQANIDEFANNFHTPNYQMRSAQNIPHFPQQHIEQFYSYGQNQRVSEEAFNQQQVADDFQRLRMNQMPEGRGSMPYNEQDRENDLQQYYRSKIGMSQHDMGRISHPNQLNTERSFYPQKQYMDLVRQFIIPWD